MNQITSHGWKERKMDNGYYIFFGSNSDGVNRKIDMQIKEFSKVMNFTKILVSKPPAPVYKKVLRAWPFASLGYCFDDVFKQLESPKCIYLRRTTIDSGLIGFLRRVKSCYPDCMVIWEIPAYPYFKDSYCNNLKHFIRMSPLLVKDCLNKGYLKKCADYISTFSFDKEILGLPTLKILNGIYVDDITPISNYTRTDTLNLISVAMMSPHHGYERLIKGLADYYSNGGQRKIVYHSVGYGSEEKYYRDLVDQYKMQDHVIFYGKKNGQELEILYESMDIAVASLGLYKKDIKIGSFIKTGEYLSKGLPMITGSPVDVLSHDDFEYFIEFSNNDSPIDINQVISFYDNICLKKAKKDIIQDIRAYAYKKVNMPMALKNVTDVMKNITKERQRND